MSTSFLIWFSLCFICYLIRTLFNIAKFKGNKIVTHKSVVIAIYVVMAILWFSWFQMCFVEPIKISLPLWLRYIGMLLFITGVSLFIFSHIPMRGFEDKGFVVKKGIYAKVRNPMYLGFIIWIIGLPVFMQKLLTLLSALIWIIHIVMWKVLEEKELEQKYSEYIEYKKQTWF